MRWAISTVENPYRGWLLTISPSLTNRSTIFEALVRYPPELKRRSRISPLSESFSNESRTSSRSGTVFSVKAVTRMYPMRFSGSIRNRHFPSSVRCHPRVGGTSITPLVIVISSVSSDPSCCTVRVTSVPFGPVILLTAQSIDMSLVGSPLTSKMLSSASRPEV